jgi:plastocyanin
VKPLTRDRLVLPLVLPVAILVVIVGALYGFSRILLSLPKTAATATALTAAVGVMVASGLAASRRQVRPSTILAMVGGTLGVAMLAGGIALAVAPAGEEEPGEGELPVVALAAADIAFTQTSLTVPADQPFILRFDNRDPVQHNVEIYENPDFSGDPLFAGDLITGPREVDYEVPALAPGTYSFLCIVHPTMTGQIEAVAGGEGGGGPGEGEGGPGEGEGGPGEGEGGPALTVVAQNIAFDTSVIELAAGTPTKIVFDNRDAGVQHNIAIYTDSSLANELFNGELITGPSTIEYTVPALEPGEYYFVCIVHPNMNGTVSVT